MTPGADSLPALRAVWIGSAGNGRVNWAAAPLLAEIGRGAGPDPPTKPEELRVDALAALHPSPMPPHCKNIATGRPLFRRY